MKRIDFEEVVAQTKAKEAIEVMRNCFMDYGNGKISQTKRSVEILPDGKNKNIFAMMPAYLGDERYFGAKIITAFPDNHLQQLPSHLGEILLFDSRNGVPVAMIDANSITWIRTAAVSALATDFLAKKDAKTLALVGAGQQAVSHLEAICAIRPINKVSVYDLSKDRSLTFRESMKKKYPQIEFLSGDTLEETVNQADIICTLTTSKDAFLQKEWITPGTHINAIGTFTPETREITSELMKESDIYVDDYEATLKESGDLLIPIAEGVLSKSAILGSLSELVSGKTFVENQGQSITIFDAVGLAIEDLCLAEYIYQKVKETK
ncbi:ornithine cyclodeaminase [Enterococcus villorum]|uniref:Ornithine cyclodeaminase n=1 Tax=Enterococcus villorum TaxID=112904 RepID=A0A1V8Y7A0_9ENTE|nr:ornithine cyclodeaminase family protein [Enterococcus villorum]OQO68497.1 ornithine cyclodeaminase [Enterococcus villorum]OQO74431.1 ornithine cyclodeaminase [Enterococcus villorum]